MASNDLHFRIATPEDAPQIQALVQSAFQAEDTRPDWTADMILGRTFRIGVDKVLDTITKPDSVILMAIDTDGSLIGSVELVKRGDLARLAMLSVVTNQQQRGLGRQLIAAAEDYVQRTWGVKRTDLSAMNTRQQLIAWYERRGYKKTGVTEPFPYERVKETGLPDGLNFVLLEKELGPVPAAAGAS